MRMYMWPEAYADATGNRRVSVIDTAETLMSGDFAKVKITGALEYDLTGELEDEFA